MIATVLYGSTVIVGVRINKIITAMILPLKGVRQILDDRGRRSQELLVSENNSVWATSL